jgi:hypothetical protein
VISQPLKPRGSSPTIERCPRVVDLFTRQQSPLVGQYDQASDMPPASQPVTHPEGLFLAAGVAEARGNVKTAIELMRQTADAAEAAGRGRICSDGAHPHGWVDAVSPSQKPRTDALSWLIVTKQIIDSHRTS